MPLRYITSRSNPRPNPAWGVEPQRLVSRYHCNESLFTPAVFIFSVNISKPLFTLAAADYLAYLRNKQIHGRHRPLVVILPHVKRLDIFRIIDQKGRPADNLLGYVAFMLRLQVKPP